MMLNFLHYSIIFLLRITLASALPAPILPSSSSLKLPDPDSVPLVIDTSTISAPTKTPFLHPEASHPPQITPESTPGPAAAATATASSEGWTPRHTLIVAIVVCISLVVIMGLFVIFYIARRNERRHLAELAVRNEKTAVVGRAMGSAPTTKTPGPLSVGAKVTRASFSKQARKEGAAGASASRIMKTFDSGATESNKVVQNSTPGSVRLASLGRPNVAGSTRVFGTIRRPPRPDYSWHDAIKESEERQAAWSQERVEASNRESEGKRVMLGPTASKESEEKEVVVVLAPGQRTLVEERIHLTGTWRHTPGRTLPKSEYMV